MQNAHCSTDAWITMFGFLFSVCGFRLFLQLISPVAIVLRGAGEWWKALNHLTTVRGSEEPAQRCAMSCGQKHHRDWLQAPSPTGSWVATSVYTVFYYENTLNLRVWPYFSMTEVFHWRFWSSVLTAFPDQVVPATDLCLSGHREENEHGFLHTLARTDHAAAVWEKNIYLYSLPHSC